MKQSSIYSLMSLLMAMLVCVTACKYDDDALWDKVNSLEDRVTSIENQLTQINSDINAISIIVNALQNNVSISSVEAVEDGYLITFTDGQSITIYNGKDGTDAPIISVDLYEGKYYWVQIIDGTKSWLTDDDGNMIPATGADAVTPLLKVNTAGYWMISYDNGITYEEIKDEDGNLVKAEGQDGDSFFSEVRVEDGELILVLIDGTEIRIPFETQTNPIEEQYFGVDNATYHSGSMPEATDELSADIGELVADQTFAPGGSSYVTINTAEELDKIYIGIEGEDGYYEMDATDALAATATLTTYTFNYQFVLMISQQFAANVTVRIVVRTVGGYYFFMSWEVSLIQVGIGELQVSLAFSNAKDIDLYVIEPNGNIVYYGNRQPYLAQSSMTSDGQIIGLDLDSNAGCSIDNVNKENIYFPADCVQKGTYSVLVDMYSNCDGSIATDWTVRANYRGQTITPDTGSNPASGTFPIGTQSNYGNLANMATVMTFTIEEGVEMPTTRHSNTLPIGKDLSESAKLKLLQAGIIVD